VDDGMTVSLWCCNTTWPVGFLERSLNVVDSNCWLWSLTAVEWCRLDWNWEH